MDRVTLYRILDSLVACGLALKAVDTRGVFRFSAAGAQRQHADHIHFRCTGCGGVFCLKAEPPPPPKLPRGFRLNEVAYRRARPVRRLFAARGGRRARLIRRAIRFRRDAHPEAFPAGSAAAGDAAGRAPASPCRGR
jgi:hypothetical protein